MIASVVQIEHLVHRYGQQVAVDDLCLAVSPGEIFGLLGPNGSGKTTLFRILSTLMTPTAGSVRVMGMDLSAGRDAIRGKIGVVFQSPSLDKELTAEENLRHHGHLYGLRGAELKGRIEALLARFGLKPHSRQRVGQFSGGMRRRVELAKGLLTRPEVLLMDEPSTGLDPAARIELWKHLQEIRSEDRVTILLTTHLMEEAEQCDRVGIMDQGKLVACDRPEALRAIVGVDVITLAVDDPADVAKQIRERFNAPAEVVESTVRIEHEKGHELVPRLVEAFVGRVRSISVGRPTLADVFVHVTGRAFKDQGAEQIARPSSSRDF